MACGDGWLEGKPIIPFRHFITGHIPSLAFELSLVEETAPDLSKYLGLLGAFNLLECWQAQTSSPKRNAFGCVQCSRELASCFMGVW